MVTKESPVSEEWKRRLLTLREGDVHLHRFSPTGFYSSAVRNDFLVELIERNERHVEYVSKPAGDKTEGLPIGARKRLVYVTAVDKTRAEGWIADGFTEAMRTPDHTLIFVTPESSQQIRIDQQSCMGCLSACRFSNWSENASGTTGKPADPRSFCIQKTLQSVAHEGDIDNNLLFAGHNAYRFATDPFYRDGFIPTVKQLVDRILTGE